MFWALNMLFAGISSVLLAVLLFVYLRNAREIRSKFAIGLVVFAALFLIQNVAGMWVYMGMNENPSLGAGGALPVVVLKAMGTGGLGPLVPGRWGWRPLLGLGFSV